MREYTKPSVKKKEPVPSPPPVTSPEPVVSESKKEAIKKGVKTVLKKKGK
jgi:hypothetical protein